MKTIKRNSQPAEDNRSCTAGAMESQPGSQQRRYAKLMTRTFNNNHNLVQANQVAVENLPEDTTDLRSHFVLESDWDYLVSVLSEHDQLAMEALVYTRNGPARHSLHVQRNRDLQSGEVSLLVSESDLSLSYQAEKIASQEARTDALTGFYNRLYLTEYLAALSDTVDDSAQINQSGVGVLFIDLDRFKSINDTLGHHVGDQLLRAIAVRISQCIPDSCKAVRLGGDEFLLLVEHVQSTDELTRLADKIIQRLNCPVELADCQIQVTPSIGICCYPEYAGSTDALLKNADFAMYRSKARGGNCYQLFNRRMSQQMQQRQQLQNQLRTAIDNKQLVLHFQPRFDRTVTSITGVEAFIRWQHPDKGLLYPADFIGIAEECGLITEIGDWVLLECAQYAARWSTMGLDLRVSINPSPHQFYTSEMPTVVSEVLNKTKCPAHLLEFEITESMVAENVVDLGKVLAQLRNLGVSIALDNFGTGYSSLSTLQNYSINCIKVDKSFVHNIEQPAILEMIIALGQALNLTIVAEGVESRAQLNWLQKNGCDGFQGYYLARPMPAVQLEVLLSRHMAQVAA